MKEGILPANAELYLRDLERALWPLGSEERETILLEIRSHLADCSSRGPDRLAQAISSLGAPEECARAFVLEGAGETRRRAGLPGRALVPSALPPGIASPVGSLSWRQVLANVAATYWASRDGLWAAGALLVPVLTATGFLLYIALLRPGSLDIWPVMTVRIVVLILAAIATYRTILTDDQDRWALNSASLRAAGGLVGVLACAVALALTAKTLLGLIGVVGIASQVFMSIALLAIALCFLRIQPWIVALAIDRREMSLRRVLAGTRGKMGAVIKGWIMIVVPLTLAHHACAMVLHQSGEISPLHLWLAGIDAVIGTSILIGAALLNATAFRWAASESIPGAKPFATEEPDPRFVEEARARLSRHIEMRSLAG